jgi:hypothetical protein
VVTAQAPHARCWEMWGLSLSESLPDFKLLS